MELLLQRVVVPALFGAILFAGLPAGADCTEGQEVQVKKGSTWTKLAKAAKVAEADLRAANKGAEKCGGWLCEGSCLALPGAAKPALTGADQIHTTDEVCDGKDNDGDGTTDEEITDEPTIHCLNKGVCQGLEPTCGNGKWTCAIPAGFGSEICDNLDNDCDGKTDEDLQGCEEVKQGREALRLVVDATGGVPAAMSTASAAAETAGDAMAAARRYRLFVGVVEHGFGEIAGVGFVVGMEWAPMAKNDRYGADGNGWFARLAGMLGQSFGRTIVGGTLPPGPSFGGSFSAGYRLDWLDLGLMLQAAAQLDGRPVAQGVPRVTYGGAGPVVAATIEDWLRLELAGLVQAGLVDEIGPSATGRNDWQWAVPTPTASITGNF